ncbi:cell wall-binding repeat-containing protein [Leifsonia poae]|uniref:cell wall-binding repeat-containing protein n=1 Tax=Leifsonia poae TaxID=110933 RepID=UPI003D665659
MRRRIVTALTVTASISAAVLAGAGIITPAVAVPPPPNAANIPEYDTSKNQLPNGMTLGPDGNMWFGEADGIGKVTPSGKVTEIGFDKTQLLGANTVNSYPSSFVFDAAGNLYVGGGVPGDSGYIAELPAGASKLIVKQRFTYTVNQLTLGPNGNLYFTMPFMDDYIEEISTSFGALTDHYLGTNSSSRVDFAFMGPDTIYYLSDSSLYSIYLPTNTRTTVMFVPTADYGEGALRKDPAGNIWFSRPTEVDEVTTSGTLKRLQMPATFYSRDGSVGRIGDLTISEDGHIWVLGLDQDYSGGTVWSMTPTGTFTHEYSLPTGREVGWIFPGKGDQLWFGSGQYVTDDDNNSFLIAQGIASIEPGQPPVAAMFPQQPYTQVGGMAFDGSGHLWFSDYNLGEVGVIQSEHVTRLFGADRFTGSASFAAGNYAAPVGCVYIANGLNFPDALSAAPAAGKCGGPLMLVSPHAISDAVKAQLTALQPKKIYVVGGAASVGDDVLAQLQAYTPTPADVTRNGGADRYEASRNIAEAMFGTGAGATTHIAFLANGANFPDALSAGPVASKLGAPVILVPGISPHLDAATKATLTAMGITTTYVAGGPASVSDGILTDLGTAGFSPTRLSGADRYSASAAINNQFFGAGSSVPMFLASGLNFPDALAGASLAAHQGAALELMPGADATCVPQSVAQSIYAIGSSQVTILGGPGTLNSNADILLGCLNTARLQ